MKTSSVLLCCLITGALSARLSAQTVGPAPSAPSAPLHIDSTVQLALLMRATEPAILLQPYDFIGLHVYGADALTVKARISPDGNLDIPLAGPVPLTGLTVQQAQQAVAGLLAQRRLVLTPAVTIEVLESPSRVLTVDGEVKNPGVYPALGDTDLKTPGANSPGGIRTLSQLLAAAGGLKDTASGVVTLMRPSLPGPVSIPLGDRPQPPELCGLARVLGRRGARLACGPGVRRRSGEEAGCDSAEELLPDHRVAGGCDVGWGGVRGFSRQLPSAADARRQARADRGAGAQDPAGKGGRYRA